MRTAFVLAACCVLAAAPAAGQVYRWTDAEGRLHFATDLHDVPAAQRTAARLAAEQDEDRGGNVAVVPAAQAPNDAHAPRSRAGATARRTLSDTTRVYTIPVERAGASLVVPVRLNDRVTAPFLIDTGASDVLVPESVAEELGLEIGPNTRRARYMTANGVVEHPVVMLDAVELGGARVEGVPASVGRIGGVGLLGLSFFNHFRYEVDAAAGVVRLRPNELAAQGLIRGGRSEAQWRTQFASLASRRRAIEAELETELASRGRERARLRSQLEDVERDERLLGVEADQADVPYAWRQ